LYCFELISVPFALPQLEILACHEEKAK
jgi:hypothetical protein